MNIRTVSFDFRGTAIFSKERTKSEWYGYYQIDFSQSEEDNLHIWV